MYTNILLEQGSNYSTGIRFYSLCSHLLASENRDQLSVLFQTLPKHFHADLELCVQDPFRDKIPTLQDIPLMNIERFFCGN
jgi:hypothetical protein